jgi:hypothetical protein
MSPFHIPPSSLKPKVFKRLLNPRPPPAPVTEDELELLRDVMIEPEIEIELELELMLEVELMLEAELVDRVVAEPVLEAVLTVMVPLWLIVLGTLV